MNLYISLSLLFILDNYNIFALRYIKKTEKLNMNNNFYELNILLISL